MSFMNAELPGYCEGAAVPIFRSDDGNFSPQFTDGVSPPLRSGVGVLLRHGDNVWLATSLHVVFSLKKSTEEVLLKHRDFLWIPLVVPGQTPSWHCLQPGDGVAAFDEVDRAWTDCVVFPLYYDGVSQCTRIPPDDLPSFPASVWRMAVPLGRFPVSRGSLVAVCCFRMHWSPIRQTRIIRYGHCDCAMGDGSDEFASSLMTDPGDSGSPIFGLDTFQNQNSWEFVGLHLGCIKKDPTRYGLGVHIASSFVSSLIVNSSSCLRDVVEIQKAIREPHWSLEDHVKSLTNDVEKLKCLLNDVEGLKSRIEELENNGPAPMDTACENASNSE